MGIIQRIAPPGRLLSDIVQGSPGSVMGRMTGAVSEWHDRARQRRHLAALDGRLLRDIGLTPADVDAECRKLPWQR